MMPVWGQVILACSALILAVGVIWTRLMHPAVRVVSQAERILPVVTALTEEFTGVDAQSQFAVLADIAAQFHTDSGTTLRDVVNRLEAQALKNHEVITRVEAATMEQQTAARVLQQDVEVFRRLAEQDRTQLAEAVRLIRNVRAGVDNAADELTASQNRADAVEGEAGGGCRFGVEIAAGGVVRNQDTGQLTAVGKVFVAVGVIIVIQFVALVVIVVTLFVVLDQSKQNQHHVDCIVATALPSVPESCAAVVEDLRDQGILAPPSTV